MSGLINSYDLNFLKKATKLSSEQIKLLVEEENDLNLVLEQTCRKLLNKRDKVQFSFPLYCKLLVYRAAQDFTYSIQEKTYVAKCLTDNFLKIKNEIINFAEFQKNPSENFSQYSLILAGIFSERLQKNFWDCKKIFHMREGFFRAGQRELSHHVLEWVQILNQIEKERWLNKVGVNQSEECVH